MFNSYSIWTTGCLSTNKNKNVPLVTKFKLGAILTFGGECRVELNNAPEYPDSFYTEHRKIIQIWKYLCVNLLFHELETNSLRSFSGWPSRYGSRKTCCAGARSGNHYL